MFRGYPAERLALLLKIMMSADRDSLPDPCPRQKPRCAHGMLLGVRLSSGNDRAPRSVVRHGGR
jgi:hypothetical protein